MQIEGFTRWLKGHFGRGSQSVTDMLDDCARVERVLGDLDNLYDNDRFRSALAGMVYSADDERRRHQPPVGFDVTPCNDRNLYCRRIRQVMSSLRTSVRRYRDFRDGVDPALPSRRG